MVTTIIVFILREMAITFCHGKCLVLLSILSCTSIGVSLGGKAVMSVDFGSEFIKVALVKPGVPMEIALNEESGRKTPSVVSFRDGERSFGNTALNTAVRFPQFAYRFLLNLLGQKFDSLAASQYRSRFPHHQLLEDKVRGTLCFQHSDTDVYCVEELVAMLLNDSRQIAERFAEQPIQGSVITVPAYFGQAERRAMLYAAKLIGLNVLQLLNSNVGVALNYGVFRREMVDDTERTVMFFDMGASSTVVTIASYQALKVTDSQGTEVVPHLTVRSVAFDRSLGGLEMDMRLRDLLANTFDSQKKTPVSVRTSPRAMAKLLKEANRVKKVLSANSEHKAQIEGLLPDIDFHAKVTRKEFEELCSDLFERVKTPIKQALRAAEIDAAVLRNVIIVGGASRVPWVQQLLKETTKTSELSKSVNSDEAAALGAAFAALAVAKGFHHKRFGVRDVNLYPIGLSYDRLTEEGTMKHVDRVLCNRFSVIPQKKIMTFNKFQNDFEFSLQYGELLFWSSEQARALGPIGLMQVAVKGVEKAVAKYGAENFNSVKAHFNIDVSGLLAVDHIDILFSEKSGNSSTGESPSILKHRSLSYNTTRRDIMPQLKETFSASKLRLRRMAEQDEERKLIGIARNVLETQLIDVQGSQYCEKEPTECDTTSQKLSDLSDWFYGEGANADLSTLNSKLKKLKRLSNRLQKKS